MQISASLISVIFIIIAQLQATVQQNANQQAPQPIPTASYVSLDGLALVVIFDKPVNLSSYIESVERRRQNEAADAEESTSEPLQVRTVHSTFEDQFQPAEDGQCSELAAARGQPETRELVHGIQLCARLLTKKTLKLLHKYRLYDCLWPSRVQFLIQLGRPVARSGPVKISFQRQSIIEFNLAAAASDELPSNEREISLDLSRLPLESLGVPLAPKLAITGPNQVPSCGQFVLSAHLSSPFGTQPDGESGAKLSWTVERIGFIRDPSSSQLQQQQQQPPMMLFNGSQLSPAARANQINADSQGSELRWKQFQALVSSTRANSLVLDSALLQFSPQIYEFRLSASFSTSLTSVTLNATHQVSRLDFETPVGAIYGTHILAQQPQLNTNQELLLLADLQVPDCAQSVKQVGLYWQVSDSRVRFEQTYAPYYLAKAHTLPDQSQIEFRLNVFYGIRVKKYSTTSAFISTGDSVLDAQISGGALVLNIGQDSAGQQLELFGGGTMSNSAEQHQLDKYTYQWSCFDGKTAQPCFRTHPTSGGKQTTAPATNNSDSLESANSPTPGGAAVGLPLIDRHQQRQTNLRLPLGWLDPEAQLWFGLQRFDRQSGSQQAHTEYALVELQAGHSASLSIGPVLVGAARQHRATLRNPLTGAILLLANSPAVVVGRLAPADAIRSFAWHAPNHVGPLHWTWRNATNPQTGAREILTELHLGPQQQVAHAHSQIQLVACTRQHSQQLQADSEPLMTASLNLDTVQSVSQCRVSASLLPNAAQPAATITTTTTTTTTTLAVSVEHCNIPLGLSPITYQIYLVDATGLAEGLMAENNPTPGETTTAAERQTADDYINEADVAFFESQSEPLSMPQLSPVFLLNGLSPLSLAALLGSLVGGGGNSTGSAVRFGGRVCDRLQTCRTFYSAPVGPKQLLADLQLRLAARSNQSLPLTALELEQPFGRQQASSLLQSLLGMVESSRRANMAGSSIGAISILNAAMTLGQRLLDGATSGGGDTQTSESKLVANFRDRVRDSLQASMRDCLHYGSVSMQRQFHYTDSGQTNLVLHSLARILSLPQSGIELKFKSLKLISQLTRRTIQEQLSLKSSCLADTKTLQRAYESLFGTFTHYAIDSGDAEPPNNTGTPTSSSELNNNNNNSTSGPADDTEASASSQARQSATSGTGSRASGRKRGQEAALAYLKSVRSAYRSLLSTAAIQLPLGESHQFRYSAGAPQVAGTLLRAASSSSDAAAIRSNKQKLLRSRSASDDLRSAGATTTTTTSGDGSANGETNKKPPQLLISSDILSSLTHLTGSSDLLQPSDSNNNNNNKTSVHVNFNQLGFVSITFDQRFLQRLAKLAREGRLLCRNDTTGASAKLSPSSPAATGTATTATTTTQSVPATTGEGSGGTSTLPLAGGFGNYCSSFVLALSSFAGKAPFRSLDEGLALRVPHVEVSLLSPIDGSDLIALQQQQADDPLLVASEDIKTEVTFTVPNFDGESSSGNSGGHSAAKRRYKCYQFDEELNEWTRAAHNERNEVDEQEKRIRCTFNGFGGVYAAFQGKPPPAEAPLKSPVVIGLLSLIALILIISVSLCCCSSNSAAAGKAAGSSSSSSGNSSGEDADDKRAIQRHPEQTYRSDFDYPRVGGG